MSQAQAQSSSLDIDSLLDSTLDDLADMPEFKPYPAGAHRCTMKMEVKEINTITSIDINLTGIETVELADATDTPIVAGDTTNMLLMLKKKDGTSNDMSVGKWKELLRPLQAHFGTTSNRETMEASQGVEVLVVTKIRTDKRDANDLKYYTDIVSLQVV